MPLDFKPDARSVYFESLNSPEYAEYSDILAQGESYLSNNPFNTSQSIKAQNKFNIALHILENGIQKERATEQAYVQNLLGQIKDNKLKQIFRSALKDITESFDYIKFIDLINSILLGTDNYYSILQLEQKRLKDLNKIYKHLEKLEGKKQKDVNNKREEIKNIYLQRHSMSNSNYSSYFDKITPTIDYLLAQHISKISNTILKSDDLRQKIKQEIISQADNTQTIETYILNNVMSQIQEAIPAIVTEALDKNTPSIQKLLNFIETQEFKSITIHGQDDDFSILHKSTKNININKKKETMEEKIKTDGESLAKLLLNVVKHLDKEDNDNIIVNILNKSTNKKDKNSVFELLQQLNTAMITLEGEEADLKKLNKRTQQYSNLQNQILNDKSFISNLQKRISTFVHREIRAVIEQETTEAAKILAAEKIKEILTPSIISITGPQFSEIVEHYIQNVGINFFSGPKNTKADSITIIMAPDKSNKELKSDKIMSSVDDKLDGIETIFNKTFQENLPKAGESTSFSRGRNAWFSAVRASIEETQRKAEYNEKNKEEKAKFMKELAERMKDSIVVTETMKTFNEYNNKIGFLFGSIGPNIMTQIGNFAELFEKAGAKMSQKDQQWLVVALVNCSQSTIGTFNKTPLEKYLSLMAGFAVFDEGSAEIELLANKSTSEYGDYSPQIMHLYKLNGLYFPGSYILQRIYDNLVKTIANSESNIMNNDGAVIQATASESLIGSHKTDHGRTRWRRVFHAAQDSSVTTIHVAFMSNLLNIVNQLMGAFTDL